MARVPKATKRRERHKQITLRLSESEYAAIRARADELDLDLTTYVRLVCRRSVGLEMP